MSEDLRRLLRHDLGEARDPAQHAVLRARFVQEALSGRARHRPTATGFTVAAAALLAGAVVLWFVRGGSAGNLEFVVGPGARAGEIGAYYAAPSEGRLELRFDDGSRVTLQGGSGVRVSGASRHEAALWVERGSTRFDIEQAPGRVWRVAAGPYVIRVTGTAFTVDWRSAHGELVVQMHEGSVLVSGPGLEGGVAVSGQERFVTRASAGPEPNASGAPLAVAVPGTPSEPSGDPPRTTLLAEPARSGLEGDVNTPRAPRPAGPASWSRWAATGDHGRIVAAAEAMGLDAALARASAEDLRALADAARFRGRPALARRALLALRQRFAGSSRATDAAFVLGRLEDGHGQMTAALEWYEAYLSEGGRLVAEARGRRMVALHQLGRPAEARKSAREYLREHPDGPYAERARDITR
jgi:hypothetical protein